MSRNGGGYWGIWFMWILPRFLFVLALMALAGYLGAVFF